MVNQQEQYLRWLGRQANRDPVLAQLSRSPEEFEDSKAKTGR